jgi:long-chain acyl-CoA synthetase
MTLNLADALRASAREHPDKTAVIAGNTRLTYAELDGLVRRLAAGLAGLGVRRGEHVALLLPNVPQFTVTYYAALLLGCPIVPLNVQLTKDEIAYHLADSDAVALVVWESFLAGAAAARQAVPTCKRLVVAKPDLEDIAAPPGAESLNALLAGMAAVEESAATMPDDTAVVLYTSGTTGRPKGAELSHFNMHGNAECLATKLMRYGEDTVALAVLPLFHSFGQTVIQNATILTSGTLVFLPRFDAQAAFELMHAHRVTLFAGVPTMYFALLNHADAARYDLSSLRFCVTGGAPMPVDVLRNFDRQYNVAILEGYGLSETSPAASFNRLDRPRKPGSIGLPLPGVEFKLVDDAGATIDDALVPGEIWIRGPNVMKGYYKKPEATAESIVNGWFKTGDIAHRDEDGYYFIVDRKKDMIIRGGYNVYPREIEEVLYGHPAVLEAAVIGVPHERLGEEVKAVVVAKAGKTIDVEELTGYCKERLAAYKYPRIVEVRESLPKTATGKILKRELRG